MLTAAKQRQTIARFDGEPCPDPDRPMPRASTLVCEPMVVTSAVWLAR